MEDPSFTFNHYVFSLSPYTGHTDKIGRKLVGNMKAGISEPDSGK
jgi:hypothetical protein